MRVLTWHVHGNYLYYLSRTGHEFILPFTADRKHPYGGLGASFDFGPNVREVPAEAVRDEAFDCVLFQSPDAYMEDQYWLLTERQRALPRLYLEHDPPRAHPTDTRHWMDHPDVEVVHVTHFNRLMWDNGAVPTRVIEHGVWLPDGVRYTGEIAKGLVAINDLPARGRRLGLDVFEDLRRRLPLDLVGMGSKEIGGLGEVPPAELPAFAARYRFFCSPIRYTSLGLAVCEAMTLGMPVVALATAEMPSVIENGVNGWTSTDPEALVPRMQALLDDPGEARRLGNNARETALRRFGIDRFAADWDRAFEEAVRRQRDRAGTEVAAA